MNSFLKARTWRSFLFTHVAQMNLRKLQVGAEQGGSTNHQATTAAQELPPNQALRQTAAAMLVPREFTAHSAAAAAELFRSAAGRSATTRLAPIGGDFRGDF